MVRQEVEGRADLARQLIKRGIPQQILLRRTARDLRPAGSHRRMGDSRRLEQAELVGFDAA